MKRTLSATGWAALAVGLWLPNVAAGQTPTPTPTRRERREARQAARHQDADEWRQAWSKISLEDRATLATAARNAVQGLQDLTPEQKQRLLDGAQGIGDALRDLTPEQRKRLQERLERAAANYAALTTDQKQVILGRMADTVERLRDLTPEQRQRVIALYRKLLGL
jgi:uncharacterized protein DUF3106/GA module protein